MTSFNNEISSAEKIGLHLSEIGRLQNNAGALLQLIALMFVICVYFYNGLIYPEGAPHKLLYGSMLACDSFFIILTCYLYLRCLTLSVGWMAYKNPKTGFHFLSALSEDEIQNTLLKIVRSFRGGTYCFFFSFFTTAVMIAMVAFGYLNLLPK